MAKKKDQKILIAKDGPYVVSGSLPLGKEIIVVNKEGVPIKWKKGETLPCKGTYSLCRCGHSKNKPHCDGSHHSAGFDGTETATRKKYIQRAKKLVGPNLTLTDAEDLCALGRFCERNGTVWGLTRNSNYRKYKKAAIREACDCPSGRLVALDKGKDIEPKFKPSLSLIEDPDVKASGPIWVKGKVPVQSSKGFEYEKRNRVTLCRCGRSDNKPFCDGSHISVKFNDGDKTLSKTGKKRK